MNVTPEQLENYRANIALTLAEIDLHEKELSAFLDRAEAERNLYCFIVDVSADPSVKRTPLRAFNEAQKAHVRAEAELKRLAIVKLRSQHAILTAIVSEADKMVKEPGKRLITSN